MFSSLSRAVRSFKVARVPLAAAALLAPSLALAADNVGRPGLIKELEVLTPNSDTYLQYAGAVTIHNGYGLDVYRWGGSSCSNKTVSDSSVALLQRAMVAGQTVVPRWDPGQGMNRCLVGVAFVTP